LSNRNSGLAQGVKKKEGIKDPNPDRLELNVNDQSTAAGPNNWLLILFEILLL